MKSQDAGSATLTAIKTAKKKIDELVARDKYTNKEAVQNEAYMGNRNNAKSVEGEKAQMDTLYPIMRILPDCKKQKIRSRRSAIHKNTYKEDVMNGTYKEDVVNKTYMENVNVPRDVTDTSSINDDLENPQYNCVTGKTGTKKDTKRLAVTTITSKRGERGA